MNAVFVFPATYSTLSPLALAALITKQYGLANVGCEFLLRGVGDTYRIESSSGRYIFRVYRSSHRNQDQIRTEVDLLLTLRRSGVSVAYPIPDLSGEHLQALAAAEGLRSGVLFSYAPGRSESVLKEGQLRSLGHEMARFHTVSSGFQRVAGVTDGRWRFDLETTLFRPLEDRKSVV